METAKLFVITFFAAFAGVVPPGLVNMTVAKSCLEGGKKSGILVAIGACSITLIHALIAILLANYINGNTYVRSILFRTGIVIFILMAIYFFISAKKAKVKHIEGVKHSGLHSLGKGVLISSLNVLPMTYFCALGVALNIKSGMQHEILSIGMFMLSAALGTFLALYLYVLGFHRIEKKAVKLTKYTNYLMAGLMVVLVILTLIRMYNEK